MQQLTMAEIIPYTMLAFAAIILLFLLVRWMFGITEIIKLLKRQNKISLVQTELLRRLLLKIDTSPKEVEEIIEQINK